MLGHADERIAIKDIQLFAGGKARVAEGPAIGLCYLTLMIQPMAAEQDGVRLLRKWKVPPRDHQLGSSYNSSTLYIFLQTHTLRVHQRALLIPTWPRFLPL
jgi:hypothetical protein